MNFLKLRNNISKNIKFKSVQMVRFYFLISFLFAGFALLAQEKNSVEINEYYAITESFDGSVLDLENISKKDLLISSISTGLVGGHRLLLNKKASTAIIYCVTLGGGLGFLPILDFFTILFTKKENLNKLQHGNFFLFNKDIKANTYTTSN